MAYTSTNQFTFTQIECANCGLMFGITTDFYQRRRDDHAFFYCPNGHRNYYSQKSELEKTQQALAAALNARDDERIGRIAAQDQAQAAERSRAAIKGVLTKTKKRIHNGVCPHCKRHFENVERHMKSQHKKEIGR